MLIGQWVLSSVEDPRWHAEGDITSDESYAKSYTHDVSAAIDRLRSTLGKQPGDLLVTTKTFGEDKL